MSVPFPSPTSLENDDELAGMTGEQPSELEKSYLAGFFDGEGCVSASSSSVIIVVACQERNIVEMYHRWYGGTVSRQIEKGNIQKSNSVVASKDIWRWTCTSHGRVGRKGWLHKEIKERFLLDILPYMNNITKIGDVVVALPMLGISEYRYKHLLERKGIKKKLEDNTLNYLFE